MTMDQILTIWYNVKKFNNDFENTLIPPNFNDRIVTKYRFEIRNKLSYFYIDLLNYFPNTDDIIEMLSSLNKNHEAYIKLYELIKKCTNKLYPISIDNLDNAFNLFKNLQKEIITYNMKFDEEHLIIKVTNSENFENFTFSQEKCKTCKIKMYENYKEMYQKDSINFVSSYMLYDCMDMNSQCWSISGPILEQLTKEYNPQFEGFSHSFNSLLHKRFCSRFWKYEKSFGSIGNFFTTDLTSLEESCMFINPPYTEKVLNETAIKVIDTLNKATKKMTLILMYPNWGDETILGQTPVQYETILNCQYLKSRTKITKDDYCYYDHMNKEYITSKIAFKTIFILQN